MERRAPYTVCSTLTQNIVMQPISSGCTLHKIKYSVLSKKSCVCLFFIRAERPTDYKRNTLNLSISFPKTYRESHSRFFDKTVLHLKANFSTLPAFCLFQKELSYRKQRLTWQHVLFMPEQVVREAT